MLADLAYTAGMAIVVVSIGWLLTRQALKMTIGAKLDEKEVKSLRWQPGPDPTVPTDEMREFFEPLLRKKEWIERRTDVRCLCVLFVLYHLVRIGACLVSAGSSQSLLCKLGALGVAITITDFFTGVFHIYFDHRRCDLNDGMDMVGYSFRYDHHAIPLNFAKFSAYFPSGAAEIVGRVTVPISLLIHGAVWLHGGLEADGTAELKYLMACAFIVSGSLCQTTHALAHTPRHKLPTAVRLLQQSGIILPPKVHQNHHRGAHDKNFCIFNGWGNPLLNLASPAIFDFMRSAPNHFDAACVPTATFMRKATNAAWATRAG